MTTGRKKVWRTADGTVMRIRDMTDSHLANAALLIEREFPARKSAALAEAYTMSSTMQGEMATEAMDQEIDRLERADSPEDLHPAYLDLIEELTRPRRKHALYLYDVRGGKPPVGGTA